MPSADQFDASEEELCEVLQICSKPKLAEKEDRRISTNLTEADIENFLRLQNDLMMICE